MPTAKKLSNKKFAVIEGGRTSENKYQILFDQASDAVLTLRSDGTIDAANQALEDLSGYLKSELVGQSVKILVPESQKAKLQGRSRPLTPELFESEGTFEDIAILRKDGYLRLVDLSVRRVRSSEGKLSIGLFRDLTEKKGMERELITKHAELKNAYFELEKKNVELHAMQEQLVQAGKMAALGELSAGIAHEINQPLQGIRGYAQEIQEHLKTQKNETLEDFVKEIIASVDKMAGIIQYLRTFTRKSTENFEMTSIHAAIDEAMKMLSRQFELRGISVEKNYSKHLPEIYANPLQLEQVFINLATNARDAIEATGRKSGQIRIETRHQKKFIEIVFTDDGCGMSGRTKAKAFNPFFTTKEVGQGMGLGLSLSYGILEKLHGSIVVNSELGKGAEFKIRIPVDYREIA